MSGKCGPTQWHRSQMERSAARLRRGRRLYIYLISNSVEADPMVIIGAAHRVIYRGTLWSTKSPNDIRYALLRGIYKLQRDEAHRQRKPFIDWWTWFTKRGFSAGSFWPVKKDGTND